MTFRGHVACNILSQLFTLSTWCCKI